MFHHQRKNSQFGQNKSLKDLTAMIAPEQFVSTKKRQDLLEKIKNYSGLEASRYESLGQSLIYNLINYSQNLPESTNSYYSQSGGVVDYALNRTEAALNLFQEFMALSAPDQMSEEQKLWQYALYSAGLLQGIGKLFTDYKVNLFDDEGHITKPWNSLVSILYHAGAYYDYEFQKQSDDALRCRLNLLLAKALMPVQGFAWIASNIQVLEVWLALLNEDEQGAGTLGAILIRADAIALQRYLVTETNKTHAGRTNGYGRVGTFAGGVPESLIEKEQQLGSEFIIWLKQAIAENKIMINKAPLMMVPGGMFMVKELFQLFVREHPEYKNWQAVQKGFIALGLHQSSLDGTGISRFGQRTGVVFKHYALVLSDSVRLYQAQTDKVTSLSTLKFILNNLGSQAKLQQLTASGQWQDKPESDSLSPGVGRRV